jgi:hypothetical protein
MKKIFIVAIIFVICSSFVYGALDLKFTTAITMNPASPSAGANVTFSVKFIPSGAAVDNLKCTYGIGAATLGERVFAHINAGAVRELFFNWTAVAGSNKVWFNLDPEKKTSDVNFQNNYIEKSFTISGGGNDFSISGISSLERAKPDYTFIGNVMEVAPRPDLIISEINITPATPVTTDMILFKVTCKNVGSGSSKPSKVSFKIGGETNPKIFDIASLNPGEITTLQREITLPTAQLYRITAVADYNSKVTESNELNNTKYIDFNVEQAK